METWKYVQEFARNHKVCRYEKYKTFHPRTKKMGFASKEYNS